MAQNHSVSSPSFSQTRLPKVNKTVFRMGIAGNYGIEASDIEFAADHGANYWVWGTSFKKVTDGIRAVIQKDRDSHVVAMLGYGLMGWQVRKSVESSLKKLSTDYLDIFKLGWLGRTSFYSENIIHTLLALKQEGKIRAIGTSIHDRKRAGRLCLDSAIDLFMIRYNAKHTGAEEDIFPHLGKRHPGVVSYTATAWRQLIRPLKKTVSMPPWPGEDEFDGPPLTPELCYRFVLSSPHVHVALTGPADRGQLAANLNIMEKGPLTAEEMAWVRAYGQKVRSVKKMDYI